MINLNAEIASSSEKGYMSCLAYNQQFHDLSLYLFDVLTVYTYLQICLFAKLLLSVPTDPEDIPLMKAFLV